jgi:hypothetical protein
LTKDLPEAAGEVAAAAECAGAAVAVECAGAAEGASEAGRRLADFQAAGDLPHAQAVVARAEALPVAAAAAVSTVVPRSVLPAELAHRSGPEAVPWPEAGPRSNRALAPRLAAVREARGQVWVSASDPRSAREVRDPALAPGSCRLSGEARGPVLDSPTEWAPESGPAPELRPDSDRPLCRVSAAERAWGVEIELRTCPRRAKTAPPVSRIAWPMPVATE